MPKPSPQLLIIDDDQQLAQMLVEFLELEGYSVAAVPDGERGLDAVAHMRPDLVILDVMLPGISGFDVLATLRRDHQVPVIMLTARGEEAERIQGLTSGADDYMPKPFNPAELAARIHNVLRRAAATRPQAEELVAGPLRIDGKLQQAYVGTTEVILTAAELHVLEQLMRRAGEVLSRAHLTELALGRPLDAYDRSIDTLISKLRKKLSAAGFSGNCIRSLRGHGYVLDITQETAR